MEIPAVSQTNNRAAASDSIASRSGASKEPEKADFGPSFRLSVSGKNVQTPESASYSVSLQNQTSKTNNLDAPQTQDAEDLKDLKGGSKEEIREQIKMQTIALLNQYMSKNPELKDSLAQFFNDQPDAATEIAQGKIPEYFNVDNTAKRILDIYFSRYNGEDQKAFAERAKGIIDQAYSEVQSDIGTLPDIVNQTRNKIMEVLDKFANGEDVSDFIKISNNNANNEKAHSQPAASAPSKAV